MLLGLQRGLLGGQGDGGPFGAQAGPQHRGGDAHSGAPMMGMMGEAQPGQAETERCEKDGGS